MPRRGAPPCRAGRMNNLTLNQDSHLAAGGRSQLCHGYSWHPALMLRLLVDASVHLLRMAAPSVRPGLQGLFQNSRNSASHRPCNNASHRPSLVEAHRQDRRSRSAGGAALWQRARQDAYCSIICRRHGRGGHSS